MSAIPRGRGQRAPAGAQGRPALRRQQPRLAGADRLRQAGAGHRHGHREAPHADQRRSDIRSDLDSHAHAPAGRLPRRRRAAWPRCGSGSTTSASPARTPTTRTTRMLDPAFDLFDSLYPLERRRAGRAAPGGRRPSYGPARRSAAQDALMSAAISTGHMSRTELTAFAFAGRPASAATTPTTCKRSTPRTARPVRRLLAEPPTARRCASVQDAVIRSDATNAADRRRPPVLAHCGRHRVRRPRQAQRQVHGRLHRARPGRCPPR